MGDPTGGLFGLASGAGGGGDTVDPNAPDSGGGSGSFDPSSGMGGADPSMGGGAFAGGAAPGVDPGIASLFGQAGGGGGYDPTGTTTAQQQIAGGGNLGPPGQPPTDQPKVQTSAQPAPPQLQPLDMGRAFLSGPSSHPEFNAQPGSTASLTPSRNPLPAVDPDPEETNVDPSQRPEWLGGAHQFSNPTDAYYSEPWARLPNTNLAAQSSIQKAGGGGVPNLPPQQDPMPSIQGAGGGGVPNLPPMPPAQPATAPGDITGLGYKSTPATPPPTPRATAPGDITGLGYNPAAPGGGGRSDGSGTVTDIGGAAGPATDAAGQQGQQAGMGRFPQSPFEQLIGQLLQPLEHMIMRALGIDPNALFHAFQGGNPFNRPVGPGYYPPGTVGGQPRSPQAPARTVPPGGSPPGSPPRSPNTPGTPPSALPPGRRQDEASLPGAQLQPWPGTSGGQAPTGGRTLPQGAIRVPQGIKPPPGRPTMPSVDRSSLEREASNPAMIRRLAWMVNGEVGRNAPDHVKQVQLETVFNRALADRTSLAHALSVHMGHGSAGYYAPTTYSREAMPRDAEMAHFQSNILRPVLSGSNLSDQGYGPMTGNASNAPHNPVASHQFARGQQGYILGGESFFQERPNWRNRLRPVVQEAGV